MESLNQALEGVVGWVRTQPGVALVVLLSVNLLVLAIAVAGLAKASRLARRQALMLRGVDGDSLEKLLLDYSNDVVQTRERLQRALDTGDANTVSLQRTPRRMGLVRYDAFSNVGGQQSFSLALLDDQSNGIVLSGLYSRQDVRVYAKPVEKGNSSFQLTPEEQRAVASASLPDQLRVEMRTASELA